MTDNYDWLFQKRVIGSKIAPNLLVLHPLERQDGDSEGKPRESAYDWYKQLAAGHWGVLFVECTTCSDDPADRGHSPNGFLMTNGNLPEFRRLVREIKEVSPETILMIQLSTGSPGNDYEGNKNFMSLPSSTISRSLSNMIKGGVLAAEAGFDGIDFKLCHGHLTFQILREVNKRQDEWGGDTIRQRARFIIEVVLGIREKLSLKRKEDFIIGARISESDVTNLKDIVEVLDRDLNLDFISVSNWTNVFDADAISVLTREVKLMNPRAAIIQAGFTSYLANKGDPIEKMKQTLESELGPDFVGFGRQAIADPLTPEKLRNSRFEEINWCKRCNSCFRMKQCKNYGNE
ncbi:MAG: oxidoreductase [Promethearchaeota archaeon]|jgi:2,4-dienoyl-CoA reductase-like NADH-dependent reductase (Old Yellow Enzyme family)